MKYWIGFDVKTRVFGSVATGLALPSSDIDIVVSGFEGLS